jgi:hypothetical protein
MADSREYLDFDEWRMLASRDPDGFEAKRRKVLESVIAQAPENRRQRLRALQWRVDQVRVRSSTPLAACISLSDMMWESFAGENGLLDALRGEPSPAPKTMGCKHAAVLQMRKNRRKPS